MDRILLMDGNPLDRQQVAVDNGSRSPGMVYEDMLVGLFPDIRTDRVNAAEPGNVLPAGTSLADYDGLVIAGATLHAYDRTPEVTRQIELARSFGETGKPILGSCWGLQIGALAAGGDVRRSLNGVELLFSRDIRLSDAGRDHYLFNGKPDRFDAPCIHYDEVSVLPADAIVLASNDHCDIQAASFAVGRSAFVGVQYHPEFDLRHMADLVRIDAKLFTDKYFGSEAERLEGQAKLKALSTGREPGALADALGIDEWVIHESKRGAEVINWVHRCRSH